MILACGSPLPRLRFLETYGDPKHPHAANTRLRLMVSHVVARNEEQVQ